MEVVSPTHLCTGSLLGCWAWSSIFLGPLLSQAPSGLMSPRGMGGRRGKEERWTVVGGTLKDQRIGEVWRVFPQTTQPGRPAGVPGQVPHPLRPPLCHAGPGSVGGREEEGRGGEEDGARDASGLEDQGKQPRWFPCPLSSRKPVGLPGLVPCLLGPPLAAWVLWTWEGEEERPMGRGPLGLPPPTWAQ